MTDGRARVPRSAWLAVGAVGGAAIATVGVSPWVAVSLGAAVVMGAFAATVPHRPPSTTAFGLGAGLVAVGLRLVLGPVPAPPQPLPGSAHGPWVAVVDSIAAPRDGDQVARLRLDVAPATLPDGAIDPGLDGGSEAGWIAVAATLPGFPEIRAGDRIEVDGRLRPPPEDDPYGAYLTRTGASGSLDGTRVSVLTPGPSGSVQSIRDGAGDALRLALPEPEAGLAAAILIGLRERVDRDLAAAFATAGVSHIVAISGWNIAIVAGILGALLRGRPRRVVAVVVGGTIAGYVVAAGASPSIVRAAVMASVALVARESGRAGRAPAALAWAATLLLVMSPEMIADAGFRLSVAATAGLIAWSGRLGSWIDQRTGDRLPGWLAESLGISLAAQAATLPDVLATFGRLSLVAPVVNLLVVPLVPVAMAGGLLGLLGGWTVLVGAPAWLAMLAGLPGWMVLHLIVTIVRAGAALPVAAVSLPAELTLPCGLGAALAIAAVMGLRRRRLRGGDPDPGATAATSRSGASGAPRPRRPGSGNRGRRPAIPRLTAATRAILVAAVIVGSVGATVVVSASTRGTRLTILDVGQGDAILLESAGGPRMLIDGGPDPDRLMVLLGERIPPWDRRIDIVVLTHPHEDHVAGLVRVLERYAVGRVYEPGMHGPGPGWHAWDALLQRGSPPRGNLATGEHIDLAEIHLDVLWPDPGTVAIEPGSTGRQINDTSIVLLGTANGRRFLLSGDAEDDVDPKLIARGLPHVDVLKVAHHGSATATSQPLIDALRPTIAVVSVGAHNDYGHPAPATLGRLRSSGARVFRTDHDGTVTLDLTNGGVVVHASGGRTASRGGGRSVDETAAGPAQHPIAVAGISGATGAAPASAAARTGYDSRDDDPRPSRGRPPAVLPRSAGLVRSARVRGRRRGRLVGPPRVAGRRRRGPASGGGRCSAARRRQASSRAAARPPPARRGISGLSGGTRLERAGARGPRSPGHVPGRARRSDVARVSRARGADRRLRRQAGLAAARADVDALCLVAAAIPARVRDPRATDRRHGLDRGHHGPRGGPGERPGAGCVRGRSRSTR